MQHKVTVFKTMNSDIPLYYDVEEVLSSIKRGNNRALIEKIRQEPDHEKRDRLKKNLYFICFSGEFKKRLNEELVQHSGLICIDFDNFENTKNLDFWFNKIKNDRHCFAAFISPSGNGIKVLFKIPKCKTNEEHNQRFDSIADYFFDCRYFDKNGKGVVRVCYESFDQNLYYNKDSDEYTGIKIPEVKPISNVKFDFDSDTNNIFTKLITWFESKFSLRKGSRNESLFYLFSACRDYGINEEDSRKLITSYASEKAEDFPSIYNEIPIICKSAFNKPSAGKKMNKIPMESIAQDEDLSILQIDEYTEEYEQVLSETKCDENKNDLPDEFVIWKTTPTSVKIDFLKLKKFLQDQGFYRYEISDKDFLFVRIIENTVQQQDVRHIKDFLLKCLEYWDRSDVYNMIAENTKFKKEYLNYLDPINIKWNKDTKDCSWVYFNNTAVKVTEDKIELVNYIDLDGFIWKTQKINRDFNVIKVSEANKCDFSKFISNICNNTGSRVESMRSAIGYLLHRYKSKSTAKAVIFNDEIIADEAMGGTGKGLTMQVIGTMRNVVIIPGADFDTGKDFAWQRINFDTDIVLIDDVERNFKYKKLFTFLTDGWPIRRLYEGEFFMKPEDSPKVSITTNYILKGDTDSYARRKFELELYSYYSKNYQPIDDFKREFISEWDNEEKNKCDNYLLQCLRHFIKNGLLEPEYVNLKYKKLLINTSQDFVSFAEEHFKDNMRYNKKDIFVYYQDQNGLKYGDYPNQKVFTQWMEYWGIYNNFSFNSRFGNGGSQFIYGSGKTEWRKSNLPF